MPARLGFGQNHLGISGRKVHPNKFPSLLPTIGTVKQEFVFAVRGHAKDVPRIISSLVRLSGNQPSLTGFEVKIFKVGERIGITRLGISFCGQRGPG